MSRLIPKGGLAQQAYLHHPALEQHKKKEQTETILTVPACPVAGDCIVKYEPKARRGAYQNLSQAELHCLVCAVCVVRTFAQLSGKVHYLRQHLRALRTIMELSIE